jgi:hypothetical protein
MPTASEYQQDFEIREGLQLSSYELTAVHVDHRQEVLFNEYSYATDLTFNWIGRGQPNAGHVKVLMRSLNEYVSGVQVIYSKSGRPYKCIFQWPENSTPGFETNTNYTQVILCYDGYAKRIGQKEAQLIEDGIQRGWTRM